MTLHYIALHYIALYNITANGAMIAGVIIALLAAAGILVTVFFHMKNRKRNTESLLQNHRKGFEEVSK
jgi:cytochrome c oxidase subunit IV